MNGTEQFRQAIKTYLDGRAASDGLFAVSYAKESKNIDGCVAFILGEARKASQNGCCGMTDDEVYSLAVHYYDEDNIDTDGSTHRCGIVISHRAQLTPEEKAEAKRKALEAYRNEELEKIRQRNSRQKPAAQESEQPTLFDMKP